MWTSDKLQPIIITYNRAEFLQQTLQAFLKAGFAQLQFHVLDNASTDNTQEVVTQMQAHWPNLSYHRNKYNIGGNANYLRALEIGDAEYAWIIGDDDQWTFNGLSELTAIINNEAVDVLRLGWLVTENSRGKSLNAIEIIKQEPLFFASISMISATILRRALVLKYLPQAYANVGDAYPQLVPILAELAVGPLIIYTVTENLMTHTPNPNPGYYFGDLDWYNAWYRTSRFIEDKAIRRQFISEATKIMAPNKSFFKQWLWLLKVALNFKAFGIAQAEYLLSMLAYGVGHRGALFILALIYCCLPLWCVKLLRKIYIQLTGAADNPPRIDRSRL